MFPVSVTCSEGRVVRAGSCRAGMMRAQSRGSLPALAGRGAAGWAHPDRCDGLPAACPAPALCSLQPAGIDTARHLLETA